MTVYRWTGWPLVSGLLFALCFPCAEAEPSFSNRVIAHQAISGKPSPGDTQAAPVGDTVVLSGRVCKAGVKAEFGRLVADLLGLSLSLNNDFRRIEDAKKEKHPIQSVVSKITGVLGEVVSVNATAASKDGAKIVLDETADWDDRDSLNLQQQKLIDDLHPKIAAALLQIAQGRGCLVQNEINQGIATRGLERLVALAGPASSDKILRAMNRWQSESKINYSSKATAGDLLTTRENIKILTEAAVADDPTLIEIRTEVQQFARPNKVRDRVSTTLQTVLDSTAYLMPTAGIAAAVVAVKGVVVVGTGGPEEDKLQHLLVLEKRYSSRKSALSEEIQLAVSASASAAQTDNKLLGRCADAIVDSLVTPETLTRIEQQLEHDFSCPKTDELNGRDTCRGPGGLK